MVAGVEIAQAWNVTLRDIAFRVFGGEGLIKNRVQLTKRLLARLAIRYPVLI
jgi:hypothetical protein